jgi:hypothetical protein
MRLSRVSIVGVMSLFAALPSVAKVTTDHDIEADFARYKTFAWKPGTEAANAITEKRIHRAVEAELVAKGVVAAAEAADLFVYTHVSSSQTSSVDFVGFGYGGYVGWDGWGYWGPVPTTINMRDVYHGALIVDLVDTQKNALVWRAVANETFMELDMDKIAKTVNKVVKKMFREFPPKPSGKPKK